ncbi:hypothetical protein INR49_018261 [Caranx melampygus]|nr:hypothetical protein INR49_018261 [Caranx melampygus]
MEAGRRAGPMHSRLSARVPVQQQSHHCSLCNTMFHQQDHLKSHQQDSPPASRQLFFCQECGKQYNTQLGIDATLWQPIAT